jgi:hypothetical protein
MSEVSHCCCKVLVDLAVIPMGGNGLDELVFASFETVQRHGGAQWWLSVSTCQICRQDWMIAQDERIYDNYYIRRIAAETKRDIVEWDLWPDEFLTYEKVLRLGRSYGRYFKFVDSYSPALVTTIFDLRQERPDISIEEMADLLHISVPHTVGLLAG